tara:strand:+ start:285 stop:1013 length:729 start_codon:yes stop_codon:yes gene_type:complete
MDHPNSSWKDDTTWNLKKEKIRFLDRDIRFNDLGDSEDHRKCFEWEYVRTRIVLGHKFKDKLLKQSYPFYVKSFPNKPYKSHAPKQRATWVDFEGPNSYNWEEDLFYPLLGTTEDVDLGCYKGKLLSYKAGVTLYLNPNWSEKKLLELVKAQSQSIHSMLEYEKKNLEKKGYIFPKKDKSRPMTYWKKRLKALGHYRLLECVNLNERFTLDSYGSDAYSEEKVYRREIRKLLPDLTCSWIRS